MVFTKALIRRILLKNTITEDINVTFTLQYEYHKNYALQLVLGWYIWVDFFFVAGVYIWKSMILTKLRRNNLHSSDHIGHICWPALHLCRRRCRIVTATDRSRSVSGDMTKFDPDSCYYLQELISVNDHIRILCNVGRGQDFKGRCHYLIYTLPTI